MDYYLDNKNGDIYIKDFNFVIKIGITNKIGINICKIKMYYISTNGEMCITFRNDKHKFIKLYKCNPIINQRYEKFFTKTKIGREQLINLLIN